MYPFVEWEVIFSGHSECPWPSLYSFNCKIRSRNAPSDWSSFGSHLTPHHQAVEFDHPLAWCLVPSPFQSVYEKLLDGKTTAREKCHCPFPLASTMFCSLPFAALCTLHFALCTLHFALCNLHFVLCTLLLCTLYFGTLYFVYYLGGFVADTREIWNFAPLGETFEKSKKQSVKLGPPLHYYIFIQYYRSLLAHLDGHIQYNPFKYQWWSLRFGFRVD